MEETLTIITNTLLIIWVLFLFYMMYRNTQVFKYRGRMTDNWVFYQLRPDYKKPTTNEDKVKALQEYAYRLAKYQAVSYDTMTYKFWKPIRSFYPEYEEWRKNVK